MSKRSFLCWLSILCFVSACVKIPLPLGQDHKVQENKIVSYKHTGPLQRPERIMLSFDSRLAGGYQGAKYFIPFASENSGFKVQSEHAATQVRPILDCVSQDNGGYRAYFSYKNQTEAEVALLQGSDNRVYDPDTNQNHETQATTAFTVGRSAKYPDSVLQVSFASEKRIAWTLDGQTVIASQDSPKCNERPSAVHFQAGEPDSLGLLYPWMPGSKNIAQPETKTAYISLNQNYPAAVVTGQVMLSTANPQALETILQDYNARIVSGPDSAGFYLVSPDMTRVDVSALEDNLKLLNEDIDDPNYIIHSASFGGLESARTFAFLVELMQRELVNGIGFNWVMEPAISYPNEYLDAYPQTHKTVETRLSGEGDAATQSNIGRRFANVIKAWDYGLGYSLSEDRSIRVAVIDSGFGGLWDHMQEGRELHGQVLVDKGGYVTPECPDAGGMCLWVQGDDNGRKRLQEENERTEREGGAFFRRNTHGTNVVSVIAAKINDRHGFAGVAPATKIIPIRVKTEWWYVSKAVEAAVDNGADVINMSLCAGVFSEFTKSWLSLLATSENGYKADAFAAMKNALAKAELQNTIVVVSAGNNNWNVKHGLWGRDNEYGRVFKNIIIVGGLQDDEDGFFSRYPEYGSHQNPVRGKDFPFPQNLKRWVSHPHFEPVPSRVNVRESDNERDRQAAKVAYTSALRTTYNEGTIERIYTRNDFGSNWGDNVDIWAPANSQSLTKPINGNGIGGSVGTSLAAPFIAGIVALMKAQRIDLSRNEIKSLFDDMSFSNQYQDFYKWQKPVEMTDAEIEAYVSNGGQYKPANEFKCGKEAGYLCGDFNLMPPNFIERDNGQILLMPEDPNMEVKTPNVPKIIRYLGGESTQFLSNYEAILEKHGNELFLRIDGIGTLKLRYQGLTEWDYLKHFYALDLNDEPVSWAALINQPVYAFGRIVDENRAFSILNMSQALPFSSLPSPDPSQEPAPRCVTDIIVSNSADWRWYPGAKPYQNPVIVPYFNKLEFKTLPHLVGQPESLPVWSELTEKGAANCTNCEVDLWHDYTVLSGYRVESAKLFAKADDEMHVFLNAEYITTIKDKLLQHPGVASYDLPLSYFQSDGRTKEVPIMLRGVNKVSPPHNNFAGIMARIEIKRCATDIAEGM